MSINSQSQGAQPEITRLCDNFQPIIPVDQLEHTPDHPFCWDIACPCHSDTVALQELAASHREGLVSAKDADRIYQGRTV